MPPQGRYPCSGVWGWNPQLYYRRKHRAAAVLRRRVVLHLCRRGNILSRRPQRRGEKGQKLELLPKTIHVRKMTGYEKEAAGGGAPAVRYSAYRRKCYSVAEGGNAFCTRCAVARHTACKADGSAGMTYDGRRHTACSSG